jgi:hypothetical protein
MRLRLALNDKSARVANHATRRQRHPARSRRRQRLTHRDDPIDAVRWRTRRARRRRRAALRTCSVGRVAVRCLDEARAERSVSHRQCRRRAARIAIGWMSARPRARQSSSDSASVVLFSPSPHHSVRLAQRRFPTRPNPRREVADSKARSGAREQRQIPPGIAFSRRLHHHFGRRADYRARRRVRRDGRHRGPPGRVRANCKCGSPGL